MSLDKYVNTDLNPFARDFYIHFKCWNRQQLPRSDQKPRCPRHPGCRAVPQSLLLGAEPYWDVVGFRKLWWKEDFLLVNLALFSIQLIKTKPLTFFGWVEITDIWICRKLEYWPNPSISWTLIAFFPTGFRSCGSNQMWWTVWNQFSTAEANDFHRCFLKQVINNINIPFLFNG